MTPEQIEQMDPETHADGFTPFWGYVVLWEKYKDMAAHIIALEARVKAADVLACEVQIRIEAHEESALLRPYLAYRATKGEAP